jgi:hypothetical protein
MYPMCAKVAQVFFFELVFESSTRNHLADFLCETIKKYYNWSSHGNSTKMHKTRELNIDFSTAGQKPHVQ